MVIVSFLGLALTGMSLKFADVEWGRWLSRILGGPFAARSLHRVFAIVSFLYFGLHLAWIVRCWVVNGFKKTFWGPDSMVPQPKDFKQLVQNIRYFLGRGPAPKFDRYTYWEKFDYFAVFWGMIVIGFTGLVLWFPIFFANHLPGTWINVAIIMHSDEALLAVGFIFTIHFFNTDLRPEKFPMDKVIFTGQLTEDEFKKERPLEYERLVTDGELERIKAVPAKDWVHTIARWGGSAAVIVGIILIFLIVGTTIFR